MIGLTLVVSLGVFASSLKASFGDVLSDQTNADLYVTASSTSAPGYSPSAIGDVAEVEGVDEVSANGWGQARFGGTDGSYSAIDPSNAEEVMNLHLSQGSVADIGSDGVVVAAPAARANGWRLGDAVTAEFAESGKHQLQVVGLYDGKGWINDNFILSPDQQAAFAGPQLVSTALVTLAPWSGQGCRSRTPSRRHWLTTRTPRWWTRRASRRLASGFIDQLLTFMTVMLALAVLIALLGIVNTLALSVFERTRELGLLRAVGMTRNQVRAMVRWESAVISLIGARDRRGARDRHRAGPVTGPQGLGHRVDLDPRHADRRVRHGGGGGRRPGRHRPGPRPPRTSTCSRRW